MLRLIQAVNLINFWDINVLVDVPKNFVCRSDRLNTRTRDIT
ncbi:MULTISPECIES: hypothetical protein [Nostocales]|nr:MULTISPECIES: hypothetical protein [Nostocales]